ncbi:MAG: glycosyltransferase family 2 protein [Hyphomicrobium sp.]|nr:glycosyltransferase family 2 protein [Hyphomicrobium sp.]
MDAANKLANAMTEIDAGIRDISWRELMDRIEVVHGVVDPDRATVYAIVHNEMFFLPALLEHYRTIGATQFLILDDNSTDGTSAFLARQPDCVILKTDLGFGDKVRIAFDGNATAIDRASVFMKSAIPKKYLADRYAIYVDADEFLVLPPGVGSLQELFAALAANDIDCIAASLVDFYPANVSDLDRDEHGLTAKDLFQRYPYFDACEIVEMRKGQPPARRLHKGASNRLFREYGIKSPPTSLIFLPSWLLDALPFKSARGAVLKTPIVRWTNEIYYQDSHRANVAPPSDRLLTIAHFKFTSDFPRRIRLAQVRKTYARASRKYVYYERLLKRISARTGSFLGRESVAFSDGNDFVAAGLMKWPAETSRPERAASPIGTAPPATGNSSENKSLDVGATATSRRPPWISSAF